MEEPTFESKANVKKSGMVIPLSFAGVFIVGVVVGIVLAPVLRGSSAGQTLSTEAYNAVAKDLSWQGVGGENDPNRKLGTFFDVYLGTVLTDPHTGMTLYVNRVGSCGGECLTQWKPYLADGKVELGNLSTVVRNDSGELQYAWQGQLLYTYVYDTKPGDVLGDGVGNAWSVVRP